MARRSEDDYELYEEYEEYREPGLTPGKRKALRAVIAVAVMAVIFSVLLLRVFVVREIAVEGNRLYGQEVIESAVFNDSYSWNSLYVVLKYRFRDTEKIPFVDTMEITMVNPHKLKIHVYEKGMMGYLYIPGIAENAYFDKDGLVVETSSEIIEGVPEIRGIDCSSVVLYEKLPIADGTLKELLTLTQALKRGNLVPDAIVYGDSSGPAVLYEEIKVQIGPLSSLTQKVERMEKILPNLAGKKGTLHLENWTEDSQAIIFSEKKKKKKNK